jgi:hypothetical protein
MSPKRARSFDAPWARVSQLPCAEIVSLFCVRSRKPHSLPRAARHRWPPADSNVHLNCDLAATATGAMATARTRLRPGFSSGLGCWSGRLVLGTACAIHGRDGWENVRGRSRVAGSNGRCVRCRSRPTHRAFCCSDVPARGAGLSRCLSVPGSGALLFGSVAETPPGEATIFWYMAY